MITSLAIGIILVCGCIDITEKTNLLKNSGFEEGIGEQVTYWSHHPDIEGTTFFRDSNSSHSGKASACIINTDETYQYPNIWEQTVILENGAKGAELELSGFIRTEEVSSGSIVAICIQCLDANGELVAFDTTPQDNRFEGTHDWTEVSVTFVTPEDADRLVVMAFLVGTGQVWFDDLQLLASKEVVQEPQTPMEMKEWTLMFYNDADFTPGFNPRRWFEEEAYSGENLNVVMLEDTYGGPAGTRYVHGNGTSVKVKDNGEVNMASSETLQDFISFCKKWYPANRYMLLLYDHGGGWKGACVDHTSSPDRSDWLTPMEMERALAGTGGVDIIGFSAPCLMGAIEPAYELRDCVDVYIGSEETSGYIYWGDIMGPLCELLNKKTEISNIELGNVIIELIRENYASLPDGKESITMSAIRCDRIEALAEAIDLFAKDLSGELNISWEEIASALMATQSFADETIDIYDFADQCSSISPRINRACRDVKQKLTDVVINECHGKDHPRAYGLTVYFPQFDLVDPDYARCGLDFTQATHWDEFLSAFSNVLIEKVAPVGEGQLLLNNGFELVLNGQPIYWKTFTMDEQNWSFSPDNMVKHSGNTSASVEGKGNCAYWMQSFEGNKIPLGKEVTVSGYIKTENVDQRAEIVIWCVDSDGNPTDSVTAPITDTKDWTFVTASCCVPEDTIRMDINLMIWGSGKVWFDDLQLRMIET